MTLMEPKRENGLFVDPVFDRIQQWIWTADKESASRAWIVYFYDGYCFGNVIDSYYVRAVR